MSLENFDIPAFTTRMNKLTADVTEYLKKQGFAPVKILQELLKNRLLYEAWTLGYDGTAVSVMDSFFEEKGADVTDAVREWYAKGRAEGAEERHGAAASPPSATPPARSADEDEVTEAFFEEDVEEVPVREGRFPTLTEGPDGPDADALKENLEFFSEDVAQFVESPLWEDRTVSVDYDPDTGQFSRFEQWKHPDGFKFVRLITSAPMESPEEITWEAMGDVGNGITGVHGDFSFPFEEGPSSSDDEEEFDNAREGAAEEIDRLLGAMPLASASAAELTTTQETFLEEKMDEAFDERATAREEELATGDALLIGKHLLNDVMEELRKLPEPYSRWRVEREVVADDVVQIRFTPIDATKPHRQTFTYIVDGIENAVFFSGGTVMLQDSLDEIEDLARYAKTTVRAGYRSLKDTDMETALGGGSDEENAAEEALVVPSDILLKAFQDHLFDASQEGPYSEEVGEAIISTEIEGGDDRAKLNFEVANVEVQLSALQNPKPHIAWNVYGSGEEDAKGGIAFFAHTQQSDFDDALAKLAGSLSNRIGRYLQIEEPDFVEAEEEEAPDLPLNEGGEKEDLFEDTDDPTPEDFEEEIEMVATDAAEGDSEEALSLAEDVVTAITVHQQKASEAFTNALVTYPFITPEGAEIVNEAAAALLEEWEYFPVEEVPSTVYKSRMPAAYRLRYESETGMVLLWTIYNYSSPQHVIADGNIGNFEILSRVEVSALECPRKRISVATSDDIYLQKRPKIENGPSHIVAYLDLSSALRALYEAAQHLEDVDVAEACRTLLDRRTTPLYSEGVSTRYTLNPETGNLFEFPYFAK